MKPRASVTITRAPGTCPVMAATRSSRRRNRVLPQPAESFHQSWTAQSGPPAPPQQNNFEVPFYPPAIIPAPPYPPQQGQPYPRKGQHFPHVRN